MNVKSVTARLLCILFLCCTATWAAKPKQTSASKSSNSKTQKIFNGKNLEGWKIIKINDFEDHGKVVVEKGEIILPTGQPATGISYTGKKLPRINYEVSLEAKRIEGSDFFCGMTFPIGRKYLSLIIGGWGGGVTGLSNLEGMSAVENETTGFTEFKQNQWYKIRLRVTDKQIQAWIDKDKIVDIETADRKFSIWWEQEPVRPFGIATWNTKAALRNIQLTRLEPTKKDDE